MSQEIPGFLMHLDVYQGHPIPFVSIILPDGSPDFRTLDLARVKQCAERNLCGICGDVIKSNEWACFIGGAKSIGSRHFLDPPMHSQCAYFAAKACPYLSGADREYAFGDSKTEKEGSSTMFTSDQSRPDRMGIYKCKKFKRCIDSGGGIYFIAEKKPRSIDWTAMPETKCPHSGAKR